MRCSWCEGDPLYEDYHDQEWGRPIRDDHDLFKALMLECMHAGLSFLIVLKKRHGYEEAFHGFSIDYLTGLSQGQIEEHLENPDIIRSRKKIEALKKNALGYMAIQKEHGSFSSYVWSFVGGQQKVNHFQDLQEVPSQTSASLAMSKGLKSYGFSYVGPTICYAFMQAVGMVNDHLITCDYYQVSKE